MPRERRKQKEDPIAHIVRGDRHMEKILLFLSLQMCQVKYVTTIVLSFYEASIVDHQEVIEDVVLSLGLRIHSAGWLEQSRAQSSQ